MKLNHEIRLASLSEQTASFDTPYDYKTEGGKTATFRSRDGLEFFVEATFKTKRKWNAYGEGYSIADVSFKDITGGKPREFDPGVDPWRIFATVVEFVHGLAMTRKKSLDGVILKAQGMARVGVYRRILRRYMERYRDGLAGLRVMEEVKLGRNRAGFLITRDRKMADSLLKEVDNLWWK